MAKTYTLAGTSHYKGETAYRFATKKLNVRVGVLKRNGHTKINLVELPSEMTKADAIAHLNTLNITAVMPKGRQSKAAMEKAAASAAKRTAANDRRKAARAAAKGPKVEAILAPLADAVIAGETVSQDQIDEAVSALIKVEDGASILIDQITGEEVAS